MSRCLATIALAATLSAMSTSSADAGAFARPPEGAPAPVTQIEPAIPDVAMPQRYRSSTLTPAMRARLEKVLALRRAKNIAAFRAYASAGKYPHNFVRQGALNVWVDEEGRMCAAATMIFRSGARTLVRQIALEDNYIRLGDVTEGPVKDWILTSGLTQAEVATIQEPFMGVRPDGPPDKQPRIPWEPIVVQPTPPSRDQEDRRLKARYRQVLTILAAGQRDALDLAVDQLGRRPDLVAAML